VEALLLPKLEAVQTPADYATILKTFYGYFSPVEGMIQQHITPAQLPDIAERRKAAAILQDIGATGDSDVDIPVCRHLPEIKNSTQAFGALYVLEGSTLGGKMIAKMLLKKEALLLSKGALTFFSGYKEETGKKWKAFLDVFNQQENTAILIESANATFYHLKSWMQHTLSHA
jgi:heme oxygenase